MSWVVTDDTPTADVVWMAAEQIGKAQNHEQLQKICDYLVNKHWFQSAGDLRSARQEATEWQALEVPGRLKLAIQHVLDQTAPLPTYGYEDYYAAVRPSLTPGNESEVDAQQWTEAANEYDTTDGRDQATTEYYSNEYYSGNGEAVDPASGQYTYDQAEYSTNPPSYDETYGAGHEAYYSTETTSTYHDNDAAATTLLSLHGNSGCIDTQIDESGVVEVHEVAEEYVEGELATDQSPDAVEHGEPSQTEISELSGTWSCGQCTYQNSMTSSFCEMCIGHISLSPDVKTTATSVSAATLLTPAKSAVEVAMSSPQTEPSVTSYPLPPQPSVTCMLPPMGPLYSPSAPDFDTEDDSASSTPLPPPPPYSGTSSCGNVDFLALAFSGSSAPKTQASKPSSTPKSSQMRREEATSFTEYRF